MNEKEVKPGRRGDNGPSCGSVLFGLLVLWAVAQLLGWWGKYEMDKQMHPLPPIQQLQKPSSPHE